MSETDEHAYQPTNRERTLQPRGRSSWCNACDGDRVSPGQKCPTCGARDTQRRFKAGTMTPIA